MANNEQYVNDPGTTLNGSINNSVTSLVVSSATGYPTGGNFRILLESEIMLVTAVSGTTWTVTRGAESTTAASHANGVVINSVLTAGAIDAIRGNESGVDVYANLPTNSLKAGDRFIPTDNDANYEYTYNGSSWVASWAPNQNLNKPPTASNFGWLNQGTATLTDLTGGGLQFSSRTDTQLSAITQSAPSTPYTITYGFTCLGVGPTVGFIFYDSGSGKIVMYHISASSTGSALWGYTVSKWTSLTAFASAYNNSNTANVGMSGPMMFLQITDDGTNFKFRYGIDRNTFMQQDSRARHDYLPAGPTHYGIHCGGSVSGQPIIVNIFHHKQT
ncbi:MAG TPA: hypothetical protein VGN17_00360 [Bryobacteraceae bacterium]|jgi:hypothetical protein